MSVEGIRPTVSVAPVEQVQWRAQLEALGVRPGETIAVRVAAMLADGIARLTVGSGTLDVKTTQPLVPGASLNLTAERQGQAVRLTLTETALPRNAPAPPAAPTTLPAAASGATPQPAPAVPLPAAGTVAAALVDMLARGLAPAPATGPRDGAQVALVARGSADLARQAETATAAPPPAPAGRELVVQAVRAAAGRQESLTTLFADLTAVAQGRTASSPPPAVLQAMAAVLGFRAPAEELARPDGLATALRNSGPLLEARLAALPPGVPLPPDLKAALQRLQSALAGWTATLPADPEVTVPKVEGHERPPLRGALPHGQPPASASLPASATSAEVARVLTERTEAALARITLLQAASLPEARDLGRPDAPLQATLEVPLRVGVETAIVQFQIQREQDHEERQDRKAGGRAGGDWTMRFSLEAEPLGPIHAAVRWHDGRIGIQLWAERDAVAAALEAQRDGLSEALEASAFTIDRLTIASGRPPEPREAERATARRLDLSS